MEIWIKDVDRYSFDQLCAKPAPDGWSLGQVCMHLIDNTRYYFEQAIVCSSTNENQFEEASANAKKMFLDNDFPNELIEGPPSNKNTPQPDSKEQLMRDMISLKEEMNKTALLISQNGFKGKTRHPGLGYFNAKEWFQFAEMHFRHHLRQKGRIEEFLKLRKA